ncbi:hypothetical protein [Nocardiopsis potens]|uniref:hypothetical protein n=1 Tax=Nocardiopsis potens TaxID=1246458 RepID=UPI0003487E4F|nr:hypothetical protein [Nocardiopsis potens]
MDDDRRPAQGGGVDMAMQVPEDVYDRTVAFYRDTLGYDTTEEETGDPAAPRVFTVDLGPATLHLKLVPGAAPADFHLGRRPGGIPPCP